MKTIQIKDMTFVASHIVAVSMPTKIPGQESVFLSIYLTGGKNWGLRFDGNEVKQAEYFYRLILKAIEG